MTVRSAGHAGAELSCREKAMDNSFDSQLCEAEPQEAPSYNQQAISFFLQDALEKAGVCPEAELPFQADQASVLNSLGNALIYDGKYDCAMVCYQQALCLNPDFVEAHSNLGNALSTLGRFEEAVTNCQQALRLRPDYARAHNNLGNAYKGLNRLDEAVACFQHALELEPDIAEVRNNLGVALAALNKLDEAVANYREALRLKPEFAAAYYNLGLLFISRSNWDDAVALLRQAVRLQPKNPEAYYHLGWALYEQRKLEKAGSCFRQCLGLKPEYAEAQWALAFNLLLRGHFEEGWSKYEWRWRLGAASLGRFQQPVWDGSSLTGRTILLHAEQGFGDTLQFIRYAAVVKQYGGNVIVECQPRLVPLLRNCPGIDQLLAEGSELPAFDVHAPLLSLPRILGTSLATVPADIPYILPAAELQSKWQHELSGFPGFKIGIAWQGNPRYRRDRQRSFPLIHFARLARIERVRLISLQKPVGTEQLQACADAFRVIDLGSRLDETSGAFMDTAAVMKNLGLVITSDTVIAHLAGALGVPVWLAASFVPDWRWLLKRQDSPWYPTMRLFRQRAPGDWDGVFDRMAEALSKRLSGSP
jgi:tetratricopeptide (TPR) repeat protein